MRIKYLKKGFTLIELLAVIVILAIIIIVAVPKILNIIEKSKMESAVLSTKNYVRAVENYMIASNINNEKNLKSGTYNVIKDNSIDGDSFEPLNNLVKIKGNKPNSGTVSISNNYRVSHANLCINGYVTEYIYEKNKVNLVSNDCETLGIYPNFLISSTDWEESKTLKIEYPKGEYKYFFKLTSGKAEYNSTQLVVNEVIESSDSVVNINLIENSTIEVWITKNGKEIGRLSFEETKIDNSELNEPIIQSSGSYPTLTSNGVEYSSTITINNDGNENTSLYYSIDNGNNWIKYTKPITTKSTNIMAKVVNNRTNKFKISQTDITNADDALGTNAYDGDDSTAVSGSSLTNKTVYIKISDEMKGQRVRIRWRDNNSAAVIYHYFANNNKEEISSTRVQLGNLQTVDTNYTIPDDAEYLVFYIGSSCEVYEIAPSFIPEIIIADDAYPILNKENAEYRNITVNIKYFLGSQQKLYKINDGEWQEYNNSKLTLNSNDVLYAKAIMSSGSETNISTFTANDALGTNAYDGDDSTAVSGSSLTNKTVYLRISDEMKGQTVRIKWRDNNSSAIIYHYFANKSKEEISSTRVQLGNLQTVDTNYTIPDDAEYLVFYIGSSCEVYEITPVYQQ